MSIEGSLRCARSVSAVAQIRLVVNADDFGMSAAISRGILRAHREGIVTSTSVLGTRPISPGARALLAEAPELGVGRPPGARRGPAGRPPRRHPVAADARGAASARAARTSSPPGRRGEIIRPRSSGSSTPRWRAFATPASPSTTWTPTTTSASSRRWGARWRRWRGARHRRDPQRRRAADAGLGHRAARAGSRPG